MINNERITILKGKLEEAQYKEQDIEEYEYNPFIEALPPIFTQEEVVDNFYLLPEINEKDRNKPDNIPAMMNKFFEPVNIFVFPKFLPEISE